MPTPTGTGDSSPKDEEVFYLRIPKSEMGRKEVKSLLGEDSLDKQEPFIPPPSRQEVTVKNKVATQDEPNGSHDNNVMTGDVAAGSAAAAMPILDPSVVPEGEGMVDG